jgi:hypothetical protein
LVLKLTRWSQGTTHQSRRANLITTSIFGLPSGEPSYRSGGGDLVQDAHVLVGVERRDLSHSVAASMKKVPRARREMATYTPDEIHLV